MTELGTDSQFRNFSNAHEMRGFIRTSIGCALTMTTVGGIAAFGTEGGITFLIKTRKHGAKVGKKKATEVNFSKENIQIKFKDDDRISIPWEHVTWLHFNLTWQDRVLYLKTENPEAVIHLSTEMIGKHYATSSVIHSHLISLKKTGLRVSGNNQIDTNLEMGHFDR